MKWKVVLKSLAVAAGSGAFSSAMESVTTGGASSGKALAVSAAVGALLGVVGYLKKSPLEEGKTPPTPTEK